MVDRDKILASYKQGVRTIVTHIDPHPDELVAILFARSVPGLNYFPGADKAPIETWSKTDQRLAQQPEQLARDGYLLIGIGGGLFDEHTTEHDAAKEGCATTLMAELLGFDKVDKLRKLLRHIESNDAGSWGPFDLATAQMMSYSEGRPEDTALAARHEQMCIQTGLRLFGALVNRCLRFITEGATAFASAEKHEIIRRGDRRVIRIVSGTTDSEFFPMYARSEHGNKAHVVIARSTSGHISVLTVDKQFDLTPLARALRMRELEIRGAHRGKSWAELSCDGVHSEVPEWYLHDGHGLVLNKSRVRPDAPPTQIPLEEVLDMTEWVLGGWLPEFRQQSCVKSRRCSWQDCPVYRLELPRCREYRKEILRTTRAESTAL